MILKRRGGEEDQEEGEEEEGGNRGWMEERFEDQRRKERRFERRSERVPDALPFRMKQSIEKYCEAVKGDIFRELKRRPKDNLTEGERKAMEGLQEKVRKKEWAIRPADKGGGITVEPYKWIEMDGKEELKDETTFEKKQKSSLGRTIREVEDKLKDMQDRGVITMKMREFMSAKNAKEGVMKINRKVHKKVKGSGRHPTRVYVSGIGTPTEGIAGLVEAELQEGVEEQESYIQDTADFLRRMEDLGPLGEDEFMFTMDVVALYPSVPREKARSAKYWE